MMESDLHLSADYVRDNLEYVGRMLSEKDKCFRKIREHLEREGIRARWNSVLRQKRSAVISEWIAPHVEGNMLDLLCGEGKVSEYLSRYQIPVTLTERDGTYTCKPDCHQAQFVPFDSLIKLFPKPQFDTVLLCTVLHHEIDPEALLSLSANLARRRILIIENCLEPEYPENFQLLMDIFFNHCLNKIEIDCPARHRTIKDWIACASDYGRVELLGRKESVPGIPLSHHMLVVSSHD
jgi:hypothetical protein